MASCGRSSGSRTRRCALAHRLLLFICPGKRRTVRQGAPRGLAGNRDFVRKHPVATKRVLRAILKTTDLCASDPARAARQLVDGGFAQRYDLALQTLTDNPYDKWREYDPEDTLRFYALRLHEVGLIKSSPQKIIADGTDWRFLNELKRELKA